MGIVKVLYEQNCVVGRRIRAGQENDAWPDYEDSQYTFRVTGVHVTEDNPYHEIFEVKDPIPDRLYVLSVRYSTGDTFGRSNGHGKVCAVFENADDAHEAADKVRAGTYVPPCGYCVWEGYFERLEGVDVNSFRVQK